MYVRRTSACVRVPPRTLEAHVLDGHDFAEVVDEPGDVQPVKLLPRVRAARGFGRLHGVRQLVQIRVRV